MTLKARACTTKPVAGLAEYEIVDTDSGQVIRHGVAILVPFESLTSEERETIMDAREIMDRLATEHAVSQGYIPAP